jgi:hypothetical protein
MAAVEEHDLEGIVAKRKTEPYRRGVRAYSQADDGRGELLNGDGRSLPRRTAAAMMRAIGTK